MEANVELAVKAPIVVHEIDDEDVDEDEESEMDLEEPDYMDKDIDTVALGQAPVTDVAQIVVI